MTTSEKPMTKEAAARIQSAAATKGADPEFAIRAQTAADRRVAEAKKSK